MSERYTRKDAEAACERLAHAVGRKMLHELDDTGISNPAREGTWVLDYNPTYGGCAIREIVASSPPRESDDRPQSYTAESEPFGSQRRSPREFCDAVYFAESAIRALERTHQLIPV